MEATHRLRDATALPAIISADPPDVLVVDIRMPPSFTDEGLRAGATVRADHPEIGVLVLSQHVGASYALRLLDELPRGSGYLLKDRISDVNVLLDAVHRVHKGELVVDPPSSHACSAGSVTRTHLDASRNASERSSHSSRRGSTTRRSFGASSSVTAPWSRTSRRCCRSSTSTTAAGRDTVGYFAVLDYLRLSQ